VLGFLHRCAGSGRRSLLLSAVPSKSRSAASTGEAKMRTSSVSRATVLIAALTSGLFLSAGHASATTVSGHLNDSTNTALVGSDGYQDLQAARFGNDGEIARNVAVYELTVTNTGTLDFTSLGYAAFGAEPYFTLFQGSGTGATFLGSNYFDPNIDFSLSYLLNAGSYMFAIGVWMNMSFAENNPDADPTLGDGFTALGGPGQLGSYYYELEIASADGGVFDINPATGIITPPQPVPEPSTWLLMGFGLLALGVARVQRG
jgi:hypothetical protein